MPLPAVRSRFTTIQLSIPFTAYPLALTNHGFWVMGWMIEDQVTLSVADRDAVTPLRRSRRKPRTMR